MIKLLSTLVVATLCLTASVAEPAGLGFVDVPADPEGPAMTGAVWSPCAMPPQDMVVGRATLPGVKDCPIAGDRLPLVVISHGRGGDFIGHHDTAETLADAGFIVAAISHPGDTVSDMSRSGDLSVMIDRPTDIKRLIDFMVGVSPAASKIDPERIGFFGFSRGGYTGLVLVGANPGEQGVRKAKWPEFGTTRYSCVAGRFPFTTAMLSGDTPSPPRSDPHSWTGTLIAAKLSAVRKTVSGSATTTALILGS